MQPALISASILAADLARLGDDVEAVLDAGADWVHVDVMDNHYVPNLSLGPPVIAALHRAVPQAVLDVHLMVKPVDALVAECAAAGAAVITVHPEATEHLDRTLALIHDHGCMAGLSLNPATPLHWLDHVLDRLDLLLLMSVNPGFGGQSFIDSALPKIEAARARIEAAGRPIRLEVDGGIKASNIDAVARAGADTFVAGSAIFGSDDYRATIDTMRAALSGAGRDTAPTSRSA